MNNTEDNDFGIGELVDNNPGITERPSIHFRFGGKFFAFFKCEWVSLDPVNGSKYGITDLDCAGRRLRDEGNVSSHFIDILKR